MTEAVTPTKYSEILCIGIGLSGICLGVQLKRKFGFTDIHFYDRNESHSGTWWANRYPGCACDVPAIYYSYSFELNPDWSRLFPSNDEIQRYLDGVVDKYHLRPHMSFRTECESAKWDDKRQLWTVHLRDLVSGGRIVHECRLLFSAVGILVEGKMPDIPGKESFKGAMFHTARWQSDVDLKDKNVIVVGNGCSGTQVVPVITPVTKTLTQFINTPHWLLEQKNVRFGPAARWAFRNVPLFARFTRLMIFIRAERSWTMFKMNKAGAQMRRATEKQSIEFTRRVAPEKYHDILTPDWELACKRRIFDSDSSYLESLHAPNLHLTKDPILEILPDGVRTATKSYPADVIVFATGFQTNIGLGSSLRIDGRDGELQEHWRKMGGPGAYNSTAVHGCPNFFMIMGIHLNEFHARGIFTFVMTGPNSATGHNSVLLTAENMINYALKIIEPVIKGRASEVEIKEEAEVEYAKRVQSASSDKLWNTCHNWYVTKGWNSTLYPWSQIHFWWRSIFPNWDDWSYKYTNLEKK